jgi:hypothetical protein
MQLRRPFITRLGLAVKPFAGAAAPGQHCSSAVRCKGHKILWRPCFDNLSVPASFS